MTLNMIHPKLFLLSFQLMNLTQCLPLLPIEQNTYLTVLIAHTQTGILKEWTIRLKWLNEMESHEMLMDIGILIILETE